MLDATRLEALGVFVEDDGQYYRHRVRTSHYEYDETDPRAVAKGLLLSYEEELVPHPVILPLATDKASLEEARKKAVASGADFYHPAYGWLRGGVKREQDLPENMGSIQKVHSRRRVTTTRAKTRGTATASPEERPAEPAEDPHSTSSGQARPRPKGA